MRNIRSAVVACVLLVSGSSTVLTAQERREPTRPIPYPVDMPKAFLQAIRYGTRSPTGAPGRNYWQQWTDYSVNARLDTEAKRIIGTVRIVYHNRAPHPLTVLALQLLQNVHVEGAVRNRRTEVTGGMEITRLQAQGEVLGELTARDARGRSPGYSVSGTILQLRRFRTAPSTWPSGASRSQLPVLGREWGAPRGALFSTGPPSRRNCNRDCAVSWLSMSCSGSRP